MTTVRLLYLYDLPLPTPAAASIQILHTARELAAQGIKVTTAWAGISNLNSALTYYGVEPHENLRVVPFFNRFRRLTLARSIAPLLRNHDIVMSRGEIGVRVFEALQQQPIPPPFVYEAHRRVERVPGVLWRMNSTKAARMEANAVRGADGVVCISKGICSELMDTFAPTCPTLVLPSGVAPPPPPTPLPPLPPHAASERSEDADQGLERDIDLLYVGKLQPRKGIDDILQAMPHLPGVRLTIAGGTAREQTDAAALARRLGVRNQIELLGHVKPLRSRELFSRAKVGLCPLPSGVSAVSDRFTSPMKILEMMACGTPIVATDLPSIREILTNGRNALLIPANHPTALAAAVKQLLADREMASSFARQAREDVLSYVWSQRARKLGEFLASILARRDQGHAQRFHDQVVKGQPATSKGAGVCTHDPE